MVYMQEIGVKRWPQIFFNIFCFLALGVSIFVLFEYDGSTVFKEGFFCNDNSIAYPKRDDTITDVHLVVGALAFSFLAIFMCEFIAFFELWRRRRVEDEEEAETGTGTGNREVNKEETGDVKEVPEPWKVLLTRIVMQMLLLIYGFLLVVFITEVIKVNMGRLRPNFLAVCQLVPGSYNCSQGFVTNYICAQKDKSLLTDSRKSFLSGHAAISFFSMIFIIFYIQPRLPIRYWSALKPLLQTLAFVLAAYVSITRITDYKHHYSDVAFGALLGTVGGYLMAIKIGHVVPFRARPFPQPIFLRYYSYGHDSSHSPEPTANR